MIYLEMWASEHRGWLMAAICLFLWAFANYWYFRRDIARIKRENMPHSWSVDMAAKTGKGGRKTVR